MGAYRITATIERLEPSLPASAWSAVLELVESEPFGPYETLRAYSAGRHNAAAEPFEGEALDRWRDRAGSTIILQAGERPDSVEGSLQVRLTRAEDATRIGLILDGDTPLGPAEEEHLGAVFEQLALALGGPVAASLGAGISYPDAYRALGLRKVSPCFHLYLRWRHVLTPATTGRWFDWEVLQTAPAHTLRHLGEDMLLLETFPGPFDHDTEAGQAALIRLNNWLREHKRVL